MFLCTSAVWILLWCFQCSDRRTLKCDPLFVHPQLLRSSLVNNRTQAKVAEELGMQEFAITNDKTKRPVALRTKTLADLLECRFPALCFISANLK